MVRNRQYCFPTQHVQFNHTQHANYVKSSVSLSCLSPKYFVLSNLTASVSHSSTSPLNSDFSTFSCSSCFPSVEPMGDDCLGSGIKCVYTRDGATSFRSSLSLLIAYSSLLEYKPIGFACLSFFLPQGIPDKRDKYGMDGLTFR